MNNNWIYVGIFLDDKSKQKLRKLYPAMNDWREYYDHMTVVYNDDTYMAKVIKEFNDHSVGKKFKLKVVSIGISDKAMAIHVEIPKGVICANKIAHITLACGLEGNAVDSNYITNWSKIHDSFYVYGKMKVIEPTDKLLKMGIDEANIY